MLSSGGTMQEDRVELADLVNAIQVVELTAKTRATAIRALVQAGNWEDEGVSHDKVIEAIEEREAAAQTIIASGFALPHAVIDWPGDYRVVLGRSRGGIDYGVSGAGRVHLIVLFVVGKGREATHLDLLASLAQLLKSEEFRQAIIAAPDARGIQRLLRTKVGLQPETLPKPQPRIARLNALLVQQAIQLVEAISAQALLVAVARPDTVPWEPLASWQGRLLVVTTESSDDSPVERPDTHLFDVRHATLSRMDRANLGLLLAASADLLNDRHSVVCVTGGDGGQLDSITVTRPEPFLRTMFPGRTGGQRAQIRPAVVLRTLSLAIELSAEGREARPVGAMFVIGDTRQVMRHARQLVLNPFHGFSRNLRNLLDPSLSETIKEFALIDGAFIVEGDGTVLSAGTYLLPKAFSSNLPSGLGARHQTAAAITAHTQAVAITVSQSTGTVTVFRNGSIVFTLERSSLTRW